MNREVIVSIIMPVYNVEKYVSRAIESILNQTLQDFEFIIVDDGTPDNSGVICDEYAEKDSRIKVIHKENGGAPSARNVAIPIAKGKYLYFLDSDDWAESTMLEDMVALAEKNNSQLVVAGYYIDTYYSDTKFLTLEVYDENAVYNSAEEFRVNAYKLFDKNLLYTPWNKLYLTEYIHKNHLLFPNTFWDDFPFNLSVVRDIERVSISSAKYYHFLRARAESETAKYNSKMYQKREEEHGWMLELYTHWGVNDKPSREMISRRYLERVVGCIENVTNKNCSLTKKEKKAEIKKIISSKNVKECKKYAKSKSFVMKLILFPVTNGFTRLTYLQSKFISHVKSGNTKLFAGLKAKR